MTLLVWAAGLALGTAPAPCDARCPCVQLPGEDWRVPRTVVPRARDEAGAIFLGRVVAADTLAWGTFRWPADDRSGRSRVQRYPDVVRYTFAVTRHWKGQLGAHTTVVVKNISTSCGRSFEVASAYLVYAYGHRSADDLPDALVIDSCGRVRPAEEAEDDIAVLGRGTRPTP